MADSFFGFNTSLSNLIDDDTAAEPSEDEYDALNCETFGEDGEDQDWEMEHEHLAEELESSRNTNNDIDEAANTRLEASLTQLVLDEPELSRPPGFAPSTPGGPLWRHGLSPAIPKNVRTVEELERQLRQTQPAPPQPQPFPAQNYFQPRFPSVVLQRPSPVQPSVTLPYQTMVPNPAQPIQNMISKPQTQPNHFIPSQMPPNINQYMPNQLQNNLGPQGINHVPPKIPLNQINQPNNMVMPGQNVNMTQNFNHVNHLNQGVSQNVNQMGMNVNQMGSNVHQVPKSGQMCQGPLNPGLNQYPHMMMHQRPVPPGINVPRQNYAPNLAQYAPNFRCPTNPLEQTANRPNIMGQYSSHKPEYNSMAGTKSEHTIQKTRIYNNSQVMQETLAQLVHPMFYPHINSMHNANHHPMLNRSGFGNQHALRQNGCISSVVPNNHMRNGDGPITGDEATDEYAGLMTQREKQWLINIQMLQLNTGTPYIHDFYYTVFLERKSKKDKVGVKEAHKANQQNHPFYNDCAGQERERERHNSLRHNSTGEEAPPRVYVPQQFENSLGKLQCGSVTAPRKMIDVEVVGAEPASSARGSRAPSVASLSNPSEVPREMKRTKQLLLDIEALYLILLRLEEMSDPLAISNALILKEREEKQKQQEAALREAMESEHLEDTNVFLKNIESVQRRTKADSPKSEAMDKRQVVNVTLNQKPAPMKNLLDEDKEELLNKLFSGLLYGDRLQQMMTVRKGRALVCRFARRVAPGAARMRGFWARVLRSLPLAARRDDGSLASLAPHYHRYIQNSSGWSAVLESCGVLAEAFDPARTPYALTSPLTMSCVCSLVEKASTLVSSPEATANERQWTKFLKTFARALKNTSLSVAKPVQPVSEAKMTSHIRQIESRSTIEILQRGRKTSEFADLTKNDLSEQLIKHLC